MDPDRTVSIPGSLEPPNRGRARHRAFSTAAVCLLLALVLPTIGCRTYATKTEDLRAAWRSGNVDQAVNELTKRAEDAANSRDAVIWRLEQATALRVAGKFEESNQAFETAEARMAEYSGRAKVRVATEAMATMTTPANLPYEGRAYDRIMAATYRALNFLALGKPDAARPALFKAYQYQQDAVAENARRIERAKQDAARSQDSATLQRTQNNPQFQQRVNSLYTTNSAFQPYAEYVNPFTVWLDGVFFLHQAQDASDLERARKSLERALAFAPGHTGIRADLAACDRRLQGQPLERVTYVIFETGGAPIRQQIRIDIPIIFANVSYIGSAWPVLQSQGGHAAALAITGAGSRALTERVASMDSVVARDFEDEKPAIISRTLISTLAKGAAAFAANEAASQQDEGLGALVRIATLAYQASVNIADTRTWTTLPKEFQVARIPTPPDRRLELSEGSSPLVPVVVADGEVNVVYVRSLSGHTPLRISQMRLK